MAAPTFRDRLHSRHAARAILSPVGLVAGIVVAVVAIVAGLPVWLGVAVGAAVWAVNGLRMLPRSPRPERIDPFTLPEPWRRYVQDALQARTRFTHAVDRMPAGPLRERLDEIAERMQTGVEECWLIARRGTALVRARRGIDVADVDRRLEQLGAGASAGGGDAGGSEPADPVVESLRVQRATAQRLDAVIDRAQSELRLLDARLDEAVARTLELSAHATTGAGAAAGLGTDVDNLVTEMEALRLALEETTAAEAGGTPGELPPGGAP